MLKNLLVHPFLFSLFPVLFLFQYNIHEIPLQDVFLPLFFSFVVGFTIWIILRFFIGGKKAGLITSLVIMLFIIFSNHHYQGKLKGNYDLYDGSSTVIIS